MGLAVFSKCVLKNKKDKKRKHKLSKKDICYRFALQRDA